MAVTTISQATTALETGLLDLAQAFGISAETLASYELREGMDFPKTYTGDDFERLFTPDRVTSWFSVFGRDLSLHIDVIDMDQVVDITSSTDVQASLQTVAEANMQYVLQRVSVTATLAKAHTTQVLGDELGVRLDALFFFSATFTDRLTLSGLQSLYTSKVLSPDCHAVIGIVFGSGMIRSRYLTVIGLRDLSRSDFLPLPSPSRRRPKWEHIRGIRDASMMWQDALGDADPNTFQVRVVQPGLETVALHLLGLSDLLSLLQFGTSLVQRDRETLLARFSKPGGTTWEVTTNTSHLVDSVPGIGRYTPAYALFQWGYLGEDYDKIDIVRDLIDRELRGRDGDLVRHLLRATPDLLDSARATYKALRERAFERYMKQRQEAENTIALFVSARRADLDKLRTDMLTRVLQFFTAIAAFLTIGVFQPHLPRWIQGSGLASAMLYIGLIGGFQLLPAWLEFRKRRAEATEMVNSYDLLDPTMRSNLLKKIPSGKWSEFTIWLLLCGLVYVLEFVGFAITFLILLFKK